MSLPLAVVYKFLDDQGTYLAALITYYGFASLFPLLLLLLLLVTILGSLLRGDPGLQQQILHSALWDFPIIGDQIGQNIHSLHGSVTAVIIGVIGSLYSGLGVTRAGHHRAIRVEHRSGRLRRHPQRGPAGHRDLLAVLVNTALFIAAFRILTDQDVAIVQIRTGAIVAAIAWQALQELGT